MYLHLIYQLPAMFTAGIAVSGVLPFRLARRFVPALVIGTALLVLKLPAYPDLALACAGPVAFAYRVCGISLCEASGPYGVRVPRVHFPLAHFRLPHSLPAWLSSTTRHISPDTPGYEDPTTADTAAPASGSSMRAGVRQYVPEL